MWEDVPLTDESEDNGAVPMPMSLEQSEIEMSEKVQMVATLLPL